MDFSGNPLGNHTASWHPEPTTRGSFTILSSCIITLTLCVWKAIHLNLPEHESCLPKRKKTDLMYWMTRCFSLQQWRKVGWLIVGILAPEMVAFTAWSQRKEARELDNKMAKQQLRTRSSRVAEAGRALYVREPAAYFEHNPWTTTHSFYAVMGGYAIDTSGLPIGQQFLPGRRDRLTLTPDGLEFLMKHRRDLIPGVSKAEIKDKSKADTFAKAIVIVQASFFIIQCLYRLIQRLPISLLELNTFAHTLCALFIYASWWAKPLEVAEPTLIPVGEDQKLWAALCFHSKLSSDHKRDSDRAPTGRVEEAIADTARRLSRNPDPVATGFGWFGLKEKPHVRVIHTLQDSLRWELVASCVDRNRHGFTLKSDTRSSRAKLPKDTLSNRAPNWPLDMADGLKKPIKEKAPRRLLVAFTLAGLSYGALHLLAWDFPFASHTEHLLWQISGLIIVASGPAFLFHMLLFFIAFKVTKRVGSEFERPMIGVISYCIIRAYGLLYISARAYLIVESFISFVYLPDAAFQQPQWTYYFPHIS